jgi:twitching motility protein PilT
VTGVQLAEKLLSVMRTQGASDLHVVVGYPPYMRLDGRLIPTNLEPFTRESANSFAGLFLSAHPGARPRLDETGQVDLGFELEGHGRFRVNVYRTSEGPACAIRAIPHVIPSLEELGLPKSVAELTALPKGLILVTGPTGSGKSTTLAAVIAKINRESARHIITIEDPIEFRHECGKSLVTQRELGADYTDTAAAVRSCLRQDPDVIMVGEMRDLATMNAALTVAETGHMALATLHTNSATQTVTRIIDAFPPEMTRQIRIQLSFCLEAVVSQALLPQKQGPGRVLATEVMIATPAVRSLIRDGKEHQLYSVIQSGQSHGMHTLNSSLATLVEAGLVDSPAALETSNRREELAELLSEAGLS